MENRSLFGYVFLSLVSIAKRNGLTNLDTTDEEREDSSDDLVRLRVFVNIFDNRKENDSISEAELSKFITGARRFVLYDGDKRKKYKLSEKKLRCFLMYEKDTYYEYVGDEAKKVQNYFEQNKNKITEAFLNTEEKHIEEGNYYEFFYNAIVTLALSDQASTATNLKKYISYNEYIELICDCLHITNYQAAALTLPDSEFTWADVNIDVLDHFLKPYEKEINNSKNVFYLLKKISKDPSAPDRVRKAIRSYTDKKYLRRAVSSFYSNNAHLYVKNFFAKITGTSDKLEQDKIIEFLEDLCDRLDKYNDPQINSLYKYIYEKGANSKIENLCICIYKLSCYVLYYEVSGGDLAKFPIIPLVADDSYLNFYKATVMQIEATSDINQKLTQYSLLSHLLSTKSEEFINRFAMDLLTRSEFFSVINNYEVQDHLFKEKRNLIEDIRQLYETVYSRIKFQLYRGYKDIDSYAGLMRHSFTERIIALRFIEQDMAPLSFTHNNGSDSSGEFILRLANSEDIDDILMLNNPPDKPYRRAVYVKSEQNEIEDAISKQCVYVIEEIMENNMRNLACVAVILRCSSSNRITYNSDLINAKYERKHFEAVKAPFKYIDFDSVLVNDGRRSGKNTKSYRGYGFMRLFLVLAEEIAVKEKRHYVSATVSSLNRPSKRNFILNGYKLESFQKYTFDSESDYYKFLESDPMEMSRHKMVSQAELDMYRKTFDFSIDEQAYFQDRVAPREFMLLLLNDK